MAVRQRIARLASKQEGRVTTAQLKRCGVSSSSISRWVRNGFLHRLDHGIYAVGHVAGGEAARLSEALLRAGPGAAISHVTAAWWWGMLRYASEIIHVCAPNRRRCTDAVRIHHPTLIDRRWHRGLPVTSVAQTLVQTAPMVSDAALRRALAQADHAGRLNRSELEAVLVRRPRGAVRLRYALDHHLPQLAQTLSPLEDRFLLCCEAWGFPIPEPNGRIGRYRVDAVFREERLAVELDGRDVHGRPAAVIEDRRRERAIRAEGFRIVRYSDEQIRPDAAHTAADLAALLHARPTARLNA